MLVDTSSFGYASFGALVFDLCGLQGFWLMDSRETTIMTKAGNQAENESKRMWHWNGKMLLYGTPPHIHIGHGTPLESSYPHNNHNALEKWHKICFLNRKAAKKQRRRRKIFIYHNY